jgi:hypothetical protein
VLAVAAMSIAASATYLITDNMRDIMSERIIAEDVWFTSEGISIYLRNIGKVAIDISAVYVDFESQQFNALVLEVQEHDWLNITFSWDADTLYHLNLVTSRGTEIEDYHKSPS